MLLDLLEEDPGGKLKKPRAFDLNPDNFKGNCPDDEVLREFIEHGLPCVSGLERYAGRVVGEEVAP